MSRLTVRPVDVSRTFVPIQPDQPITSEIVEGLWSRHLGALSWNDLFERPRVVILAEANSGKTFEFERQVEKLRLQGKYAFFAPIEQLAEAPLEIVLDDEARTLLQVWQASGQPAWFFLDSVDEAKLTHRNFELSLKQFAKNLGPGYQRARILVSCRGTDWNGEADLKLISSALPAGRPADGGSDADVALLGRLTRKSRSPSPTVADPPACSVVSMTALTASQRRQFLEQGVQLNDIDKFEEALVHRGLLDLSNRPGDLLVLAAHWLAKGALGSLTEMMEVAITGRLADRPDRPDASVLTDREARYGAERIAAAMVLGRAVTVQIAQPKGCGGVSLPAILDDWTIARREALIRRGVFAAATYGQARFTNRSIMEYLAAQWFIRRLDDGCPEARVMAVLTAKPFGIDTIPPSLRATAGWVARRCSPLRRFILENAPMTLLHHGDPASLDIADRSALLRRYADLRGQGRIRTNFADEHLLRMFADPALAPTIKAVWPDADDDFRFELLRLVEQGGLSACAKLASETVLAAKASDYTRLMAARVLVEFSVFGPLRQLAKQMVAAPDKLSLRSGPQLATVLFPKALSMEDLLALMDGAPRARAYQVEGFGYVLEALYAACPSPKTKQEFVAGVAALCRRPPLKGEYEPYSQQHAPIARRVAELLVVALEDVPTFGIWPGLVDLAWVAEVADLDWEPGQQTQILAAVRRHVPLNRALFWLGVERAVAAEPELDSVRLWFWQRLERQLWSIGEEDRGWLEAAASDKDVVRRRVAFAALISLNRESSTPEAGFADLRRYYGADPQLMADLDEALKPPVYPPAMVEHAAREAGRQAALAEAEALNHQAWRALRDEVNAAPDRLRDERLFHRWPDYRSLVSLTDWLTHGRERDKQKAVLTYSDLANAFSSGVAEAYRAAMVRFWRVTKPRAPRFNEHGGRTTPWSTVLAMAGLALDAATTPSWVETLGQDEAQLAVRHAFISGMDFPDWLDSLLVAFPQVVQPSMARELRREWSMEQPAFTPLLYRAGASLPITAGIQEVLLKLIETETSAAPERMEHARKILRRLTLTSARRRRLANTTDARIRDYREADDWESALALLPVLFVLDSARGAVALQRLLADQSEGDVRKRSERTIGALFGVSHGSVWGLKTFPEAVLADLLRLTYHYIRPEDDRRREGAFQPDSRDDAEMGRNELLGALMDKPGEGAYLLMRQLLAEGAFGESTPRLHRLAQEMAEAASEGGPWDEAAVLRFEAECIEPATTGERLFALVCELIEDIGGVLQGEDVSARELLLTAKDEHAVQSWFAKELRGLSRDRFAVVIENEAPGRNRMDITIISRAADAEVSVEMKHGGKGWTLPELKAALTNQLAKRYLKAANRRHGVFVVSNHGPRQWTDESGHKIEFAELLKRLQAEAETITANRFGPAHIAVRGLNAVLPEAEIRSKRRRGKPSRAEKERQKPQGADPTNLRRANAGNPK
jgi:hypothetical protein